MKRRRGAEKRLPTCHPRSLLVKPFPVQQHKCPICVCLPVDTGGWVLVWARKLCLFFYRPWQLTGYWEQGANDTATQQISTSSASCSSEQIQSLPPLRHNRTASAKQPPAKRAPPPFPATKLPSLLFLWATAASRTPSLISGRPRPQLARCVYFRWANIATCLRVQWPVLSGELCIVPCLLCNRGTCGLTQQPVQGMAQGNSAGTAGVSKSNTPWAHLHFPRVRKPFSVFVSCHCSHYNQRVD